MDCPPPPHLHGIADLYTDRPPGVADLYTGRSGGERVAARWTALAGGAAVLLQSRLHIGHRLQTRTAVGCIHLPPEETIDGSTHCIVARFSLGGEPRRENYLVFRDVPAWIWVASSKNSALGLLFGQGAEWKIQTENHHKEWKNMSKNRL